MATDSASGSEQQPRKNKNVTFLNNGVPKGNTAKPNFFIEIVNKIDPGAPSNEPNTITAGNDQNTIHGEESDALQGGNQKIIEEVSPAAANPEFKVIRQFYDCDDPNFTCCGGAKKYRQWFGGKNICGCRCSGENMFSWGHLGDIDDWYDNDYCDCKRSFGPGQVRAGSCINREIYETLSAAGMYLGSDRCATFYCSSITPNAPSNIVCIGSFCRETIIKCPGYGILSRYNYTDSSGYYHTNLINYCDCECAERNTNWPPECPPNYEWDGSDGVCDCVYCPVRQYTCTDDSTVDDCANCPPGYTCDPGDPANSVPAGCSIVTEVDSVVASLEDCEALLGVAPHSGQWSAGYYCVPFPEDTGGGIPV